MSHSGIRPKLTTLFIHLKPTSLFHIIFTVISTGSCSQESKHPYFWCVQLYVIASHSYIHNIHGLGDLQAAPPRRPMPLVIYNIKPRFASDKQRWWPVIKHSLQSQIYSSKQFSSFLHHLNSLWYSRLFKIECSFGWN